MVTFLHLEDILWILMIFSPSLQEEGRKRYLKPMTINYDWDNAKSKSITYSDTLINETIYIIKTRSGLPLFYQNNVVTGICFDNKCRPLNMIVYWNITGRYLGFELPEGEFLSKSDHEPFTPDEYDHLHELLADSLLPLGNISFEEIIQQSNVNDNKIDGISGATSGVVSDYVVKGAAYTTHKLWNIIYGPIQEVVMRITESELTPELTSLILSSSNVYDRIWTLNRIKESMELNRELVDRLMDIIEGDDFSLSVSAINAIKPSHLKSDSLQIRLFTKYEGVNFSIKRLILNKLMEASVLAPEVVKLSRKLLNSVNGEQLGIILELYNKHSINDVETYRYIANLLFDNNNFISKKAYDFLKALQHNDKIILKAIDDYERRM